MSFSYVVNVYIYDVYMYTYAYFLRSHLITQSQVDVNASQNSLTGGVLACKGTEDEFGQIVMEPGDEAITLVVVEGGPKAIARFKFYSSQREGEGDFFLYSIDDD